MKRFINLSETTMPFTSEQFARGADYTLETFRRNDPIDQITTAHTTLKWLLANKQATLFGNGYFNEAIFVDNNSNFQNYFGADQVTYNERDPARQAKYTYANYHDGFWFDEDRLAANGIIVTDDRDAVPSGREKQQLVNLLQVSYTALKQGINEALALELLQDGSANAKAIPGLDHLVSTDPITGTVGNIDASKASYWRNNANLEIAEADLIEEMEQTWRDFMRYGGQVPNKIIVGSGFLDAYRKAAGTTINRQIEGGGNAKGGVSLDASTTNVYFHGIALEWDPTFETLDAKLGSITYPWTDRCYFLNSNTLKFRPMQGHWMVKRKPERLPDRYVHYFGQTGKYGFTANKRNSNAVLSYKKAA
jgi:hypothetical protein